MNNKLWFILMLTIYSITTIYALYVPTMVPDVTIVPMLGMIYWRTSPRGPVRRHEMALELIERRFGTMPNLFAREPEGDLNSSRSDESEAWPDTDDVMSEIKNLKIEDEIGEPVAVPPAEVVAEKKTLLSKLHSFEKKDENADKAVFSDCSSADGEKEEMKAKIVIEPPTPPPKKVEVSDEEVKARQEYLKQQRDKLLALKKQVREKRLGATEADDQIFAAGGEGSLQSTRPKSARVAQAALAGKTPAPPPDALVLRRALASKLKTEVVDTK